MKIHCPSCGRLRSVEQIATTDGWKNPPCWFCGDPGWMQPYDAEDPLAELAGNPVLVPAKALHSIDRIIGNEETITAEQLGEVRGIVLDALNMWHNAYKNNASCHETAVIDLEDMGDF
jgi:hypothetical protein